MKYIKPIIILVLFSFFGCKDNEKSENSNQIEENNLEKTTDVAELEKLTRDLYKWIETESSIEDFVPLQKEKTDTIYTKLDLELNEKRVIELINTNFFTKGFIENYKKIVLTIDQKMRNKTLVYYIGNLPPYGNDANPWCNCQDNPEDYWGKISLKDVKIINNKATYKWTWGDQFEYKVEAEKENGVWKISYLQGFDFNQFIPKD